MGQNEKEKLLNEMNSHKVIYEEMIKDAHALSQVKNCEGYATFKKIFDDIEANALLSLQQEITEDKIIISGDELKLRQRVYNRIRYWNKIIDHKIEQAKQASKELELINKQPEEYIRRKHNYN